MNENNKSKKSEKTILKAIGSVLFAIIASSHHWIHTLLIAIGLTSLGAGLLALPPSLKAGFLMVSLIFSIWFIMVSRRKWSSDRPAAVVYLISSLISIVLVITAIPKTIGEFYQTSQPQRQQEQSGHSSHHSS
ncbi:hypothetical protein CBU02nite_23040 [Clostridium butyricum]|uniref:Uncharacterized protein n=1 Tax=Clostridium butyricum TaxID=1492 RepID=A0A512TP94_CLOBU|nr:hypothetical protein [Clostridium butyricum]NAS17483.1 hypothetical protein [Clostridium butyricum]NOW22668.1 putative membrane protein [Clostridium butyricum]GEQ21798.1 hypothetical protein CBU02nite_23040 [Clostridium butyricum]